MGKVKRESSCLANITTEIRDAHVVREDARRARMEFGFLRMWSIHPNQILPIIEAMRPDFAEVSEAATLLAAARMGCVMKNICD